MGNQHDKEINYLRKHTIFKEKEIRDYYDYFMTKWPDVKIDIKSFAEFMQAVLQKNTDSLAKHYFRNICRDRSDNISFRDFMLYLSSEASLKTHDRITWLFGLFDIDGSGSIERHEMVEIFKCAMKLTKGDVEAEVEAEKITSDMFKCYATDKSNFISRPEFQRAFMEEPQTFMPFPSLYDNIFNKEYIKNIQH